ncbi:MAG: TlpA disulfide reductase family protein [Anaerolineales bacterium]
MNHSQSTFKQLMGITMIGAGLLALGLMFFLMTDSRSPAESPAAQEFSAIPVEVNYPAPDLTLQDLAGNPVSLRALRGQAVLVNLWATWCPPCKAEMPTLQAFYEKYKDKGFTLVAINQEEPRETVAPFVKTYGLTFPVWLDLEYLAERKFNTMNLPSSYVIDRSGAVRLMWVGAISKTNLEKYAPRIIEEK